MYPMTPPTRPTAISANAEQNAEHPDYLSVHLTYRLLPVKGTKNGARHLRR